MIFSKLTAIDYTGKKIWFCLCECDNLKPINGVSLKFDKTYSYEHNTIGFKDITNQVFGDLKVLNYTGNSKWT